MCAINGFNWNDEALVRAMNQTTLHRGPDGSDTMVYSRASLGHNRLAIIDLNDRSRQPMSSLDGRLTIVFNGEIYNYRELRKQLSDVYVFTTESDTEVILAAYHVWGRSMLEHLRGMFAFAIYDKERDMFFLARDHAGMKPLYYFWDGTRFVFSSELRGVLVHSIVRHLNLESLARYMSMQYAPSPQTMITGISKLPPATWLTLTRTGSESVLEQGEYWSASAATVESHRVDEAAVRGEIERAVDRHLVADRPVGIFLSGGLDSSIVLHHAAARVPQVGTFSVGFDLPAGSESELDKFNSDMRIAARTAQLYGATHHELRLTLSEVERVLEPALASLDEPIANPTSIALYCISKEAAPFTPVVLTGDGADELFGGYERHRLAHLANGYQRLPGVVRHLSELLSVRAHKLAIPAGVPQHMLFMAQSDEALARIIKQPYLHRGRAASFFRSQYTANVEGSSLERFMDIDRRTWLADESLMKFDAMSMAHGVEGRVPFLDRDLMECALGIPVHDNVSFFTGKIALRNAYRHVLPEYLFQQPKRGWISPGAKWLRDPAIIPQVDAILSPGYYGPTADIFAWSEVENMLTAHREHRAYNLIPLWAILTFQVWARRMHVVV